MCCSPRSGSTLLCWALADTGVLGRPEEYFLDGPPEAFPPGWQFWEKGLIAFQHGGPPGRKSYLELVFRLGTTPNGVFAAKMMWTYLPWLAPRLHELPDYAGLSTEEVFRALFPGLHVVHLVRRDRARQAISWAKATQDGVWIASDDMPARPTGTPAYDFEFIRGLETLIAESEHGWREFFRSLQVVPYEVAYEDLVTDEGYREPVTDIARHLDVGEVTFEMPRPRSHRQTDRINDEWLERYLRDERTRQGPSP